MDQERQLAIRKFNSKAKDGIKHLLERGVLSKQPEEVADFLRTTKGLSKRRIGDYLGEPAEFVTQVLTAYTKRFDFNSKPFVEAVRSYLSPFRLPGEAQKIDRIMCTFGTLLRAEPRRLR